MCPGAAGHYSKLLGVVAGYFKFGGKLSPSQTLQELLIQPSSRCNIRTCYISLDDIISLQSWVAGGCHDKKQVKSNVGEQIRVVGSDLT